MLNAPLARAFDLYGMTLKDECINSLNEALAEVKAVKGEKRGAICKLPSGDPTDPNNVVMVFLDVKKQEVCITAGPPSANCVQVTFDTHEDHWSWKALHAALFD